jgi:hypothetical protein
MNPIGYGSGSGLQMGFGSGLSQGNTFLEQGLATLSQHEQALANYSFSTAPQSAISNTGWLLLLAAALTIGLVVYVK